jgi:hypothetical protein
LGRFVAARKQNHQFHAAFDEIEPIPRTVMNTHFRHTFAYRLAVSKISQLCAADPHLDARSGLRITQGGKP